MSVLVLAARASVEETHPEIAITWNRELNAALGLHANQTHAGSKKKVWWDCSNCGKPYLSSVQHRANGVGCSCCAGRNIHEGCTSLLTTHPEIVATWNVELNQELGLSPSQFRQGSTKKVWWDCDTCEQPYLCSIKHRTDGVGCSCCAGQRTHAGCPNLTTTHPALASEWNYALNTEDIQQVTQGSHKQVWWNCSRCDKPYRSRVSRRAVDGYGHKECSQSSVSWIETQLFEGLVAQGMSMTQQHMVEGTSYCDGKKINTDIFFAEHSLVIEYDGVRWHSDETTVQRDYDKTQAMLKAGYKVVRVREQSGNRILPFLDIHEDGLIQMNFKYSKQQDKIDVLVDNVTRAIKTIISR